MLIQQFFVGGLAHCSYFLEGRESCAVIDPRRDVRVYLETIKSRGLRLTHILETHLHADFVSGHLELAARTGAEIYAPRAASCAFPHRAVAEGDAFAIDDMEVRVLETPGHTPEHVVYVVADGSRSREAAAVFTGDVLFVGDVGRPDLFPGRAQALAGELYDSLHLKILKLPDFCEVYPAHGAGSLCGREISAKRTTTVGYERRHNYALTIADREEFIARLTTGMPAAPDHFTRCSEINRRGPALVAGMPPVVPLAPEEFRTRSQGEGTIVLDVRSYEAFGGCHVPGAYHIDITSNISTFAGWILPPEVEVLLVTEGEAQVEQAATLLRRVGVDRIGAWLAGGMFAWANAGYPAGHVPQLAAPELAARLCAPGAPAVVDVRAAGEFAGGHIPGAIHIPAPDLRTRYDELDPDTPYVTVCNVGQRASMAASLLKRRGFREVMNLAGGMTGYNAATGGGACPVCALPHGPSGQGARG
ncbi:MAG TPA: rhodanese-like domain-containing protein [Syntrophales bacterium]|nr:rhodanese-like domain-containing protein [Syntrophales bacterium]HPC31623.1 rhodanese-like domain-containing protein [Syntrophales bacterium]